MRHEVGCLVNGQRIVVLDPRYLGWCRQPLPAPPAHHHAKNPCAGACRLDLQGQAGYASNEVETGRDEAGNRKRGEFDGDPTHAEPPDA